MSESYREALGIAVGDLIWRPREGHCTRYRVTSIWGPIYWWEDYHSLTVWPYPVISLRLRYEDPARGNDEAGISHIHQDGEHWFDDLGWEIFVEHGTRPLQMGLFETTEPQPYPFQEGLDYLAGDGRVWHCPKCGRDFNGLPEDHHAPRHCPGWTLAVPIVMMRPEDQRSNFVRLLSVPYRQKEA